MKLLIMGKAETLHFKDDTYFFTGAGQQYQVPSVIRLKYNIKKKATQFTRSVEWAFSAETILLVNIVAYENRT
jgi:hypothetical protein